MFLLLCVLIGYAIGCIQTSYIMGKLLKGIDIREHGSGNAGMTNTFRVLGTKAGITVFVVDFLKAALAYYICALLFGGSGTFLPVGAAAGVMPGLCAGAGVTLGHNFTFYLKFKGGKGFASILGMTLMLDWRVAVISYGIVAVIVVFTRYISLSALVMTLLAPFLLWAFGHDLTVCLIFVFLTAMTWVLHRENIARLLKGTENKFSLRRRK